MKRYKAPKATLVKIDEELLFSESLGKDFDPNAGSYSKKNNQLFDDDEEEGL